MDYERGCCLRLAVDQRRADEPRVMMVDARGVGLKTRRVGPTGRTPGGSPATPQKQAQEMSDSPHF